MININIEIEEAVDFLMNGSKDDLRKKWGIRFIKELIEHAKVLGKLECLEESVKLPFKSK